MIPVCSPQRMAPASGEKPEWRRAPTATSTTSTLRQWHWQPCASASTIWLAAQLDHRDQRRGASASSPRFERRVTFDRVLPYRRLIWQHQTARRQRCSRVYMSAMQILRQALRLAVRKTPTPARITERGKFCDVTRTGGDGRRASPVGPVDSTELSCIRPRAGPARLPTW